MSFDPRDLPRLDYDALCKLFPLRPILDEWVYRNAQAIRRELSLIELNPGQADYAAVLSLLTERYLSDLFQRAGYTRGDIIRKYMGENNLRPLDLARRLGIPRSNLSAMMHGRRPIPKAIAVSLGQLFGVPAGWFLIDWSTTYALPESEEA